MVAYKFYHLVDILMDLSEWYQVAVWESESFLQNKDGGCVMKKNKVNKIVQIVITVIAILLTIISAVLLVGEYNASSKSIIALVLIASALINLGDLLAKYKKDK